MIFKLNLIKGLDMKCIIILGSKPYVKIPAGDIIYSANGATFINKITPQDFTKHINVAHVYALSKGLEQKSSQALHSLKLKEVHDNKFERLVLFQSSRDNGKTNKLKKYLENTHHEEIEVITFCEQRKIVREIGKRGYPIINKYFFYKLPSKKIRDGIRIIKALISWRYGRGYIDVGTNYRPSTGILALLIAIKENGPTAQYILCGVGIKNRNQFLIDNQILLNNPHNKNAATQHSYADQILLKSLSTRFNLQTVEKELYHILPKYKNKIK